MSLHLTSRRKVGSTSLSNGVIYAILFGIACLALAAVLLIAPGEEGTQRIATILAFLGTIVVILANTIRSDQAAGKLNGSLDARIQDAVQAALTVSPEVTKLTDAADVVAAAGPLPGAKVG